MISYSIDVLKDRNVNKGDRVIYKGKNSVEWLAWNIATQSVGGVWVPLYSNQKEEYCKYIVDDCNPKVLISDPVVQAIKETAEKADMADLAADADHTPLPAGWIADRIIKVIRRSPSAGKSIAYRLIVEGN